MRIFNTFLILVVVALLWMLPFTEAIYDFRTDVRDDYFYDVTTAVGITTTNVTLLMPVYDNDSSTITILSDISTDNATVNSYNSTTRVLSITNLAANDTRDLTVSYDVGSLSDNSAFDTFLNQLPWIWMLVLFAFPLISLIALWGGSVRGMFNRA
jgi:hypothetical protein